MKEFMTDFTLKSDGTIDYEAAKAILNGEVECAPEEYDEAVAMATKCIELLVYVAKEVNDPCSMSSLMKERIRRKLNKELKNSNENYIMPSAW